MEKAGAVGIICVCGERDICMPFLRLVCGEMKACDRGAEIVCFFSREDVITEAAAEGVLRSAGIAESEFAPEDVVDAVKRHPCAVVLLDLDMPGLDGLNVAEALAEAGLSRNVILLSWFYSPLQRKIIAALEISYCFTKPVDVSTVFKRIVECGESLTPSEAADSLYGEELFLGEPCAAGSIEDGERSLTVKNKTTVLLHEIGVPANLCGHEYIREAVLMAVEMDELYGKVTKVIYPAIAARHHKSSCSVEKAIRTALETAWIRGRVDLLNDMFGFTVSVQKGKPTNSEFIALLADRLKS